MELLELKLKNILLEYLFVCLLEGICRREGGGLGPLVLALYIVLSFSASFVYC